MARTPTRRRPTYRDELTDDEAAALRVICDTFGLDQCPGCGRLTPLSHNGNRSCCYPCTIRELGIDYAENAARIALGWTLKRFLAWPRDTPYPFKNASAFRRRVGGPST